MGEKGESLNRQEQNISAQEDPAENLPASTSVLWNRFSEWTSLLKESLSATSLLLEMVLGAALLLKVVLILVLVLIQSSGSSIDTWERQTGFNIHK